LNYKIEELIRIKKALEEDEKDDDDLKINVLKHLKQKEVTYNDLSVTKIGKTVNKLSKHKNAEIASIAAEVVNVWKKKCKKPDEPEKSASINATAIKDSANKVSKPNGVSSKKTNGNTEKKSEHTEKKNDSERKN